MGEDEVLKRGIRNPVEQIDLDEESDHAIELGERMPVEALQPEEEKEDE